MLLARSCLRGQVLGVDTCIEDVDKLHWLINEYLLVSLQRLRPLEIKDMHEVPGIDLDAELVRVRLVEGLDHALGVVVRVSAGLHQLDGVVLELSGAALGSVV